MAEGPGKLYVTSADDHTVIVCDIDIPGTLVRNCGRTGSNFNRPHGVILHLGSMKAYVTNPDGKSLTICNIDSSTFQLFACKMTGEFFGYPIDLAIEYGNGDERIFVTNQFQNTVTMCDLSDGNDVTNCANTGNLFSFPRGILVHPEGTRISALNFWENKVVSCNITADGLSGCTKTGALLNGPSGMALMGNRVFITNDFGQSVVVCRIDGPTYADCVTNFRTELSRPFGIGIHEGQKKFYVANTGSHSVSVCGITANSPFVGSCVPLRIINSSATSPPPPPRPPCFNCPVPPSPSPPPSPPPPPTEYVTCVSCQCFFSRL